MIKYKREKRLVVLNTAEMVGYDEICDLIYGLICAIINI